MATKKKPQQKKTGAKGTKGARIERPYPRETLEEAIKVPLAIRHKNGGNPWPPAEVAGALERGATTNAFFYVTTASRDYGLTSGTRDTAEISLTDLGRRLAYAETSDEEAATRREAFRSVQIFKDVLEYYKGSNLPEMKYLKNTLEGKFQLDPRTHDEFAGLFRKNCEYLNITEGLTEDEVSPPLDGKTKPRAAVETPSDFVTVAEPEGDSKLLCFVAMPFGEEKTDLWGRKDRSARRILQRGSEANHRSCWSERRISCRHGPKEGQRRDTRHNCERSDDADMVVADLTEHNPNVLFELGVRMANDKPVALIRAAGTAPVFDVDHMLRVEEYSPCLWPSTVETDLPKIQEHVTGAWKNRDSAQSYMKILRDKGKQTK